jgi:hypothetical protein
VPPAVGLRELEQFIVLLRTVEILNIKIDLNLVLRVEVTQEGVKSGSLGVLTEKNITLTWAYGGILQLTFPYTSVNNFC